jgi:hypothetical protein
MVRSRVVNVKITSTYVGDTSVEARLGVGLVPMGL